jgi:hypothetical protein
MTVEVLDYDDVAMLDGLPAEEARPSRRWEALEMVWKFALTVGSHPPGPDVADRLVRLSHVAWTVATADDEPTVN